MTFASEIVADAAALILVDEGDISLEPDEFALGTRFLNDFAAELFDLGVDFGYRPVAVSADPLTSPASVNTALKQNLGIRLAPAFGVAVSADLRRDAKDSLNGLMANFMRLPRAQLPATVPMGGGRHHASFFPFTRPDGILRLNSSSTITITTINTPVIVDGWTVDRSVNITGAAGGTYTYKIDKPFLAMLEASFTVDTAGSDQFTFYFRKNSAIIEQSRIPFDADAGQNILMKWPETLRRGDTVSIVVENNDGTTNITFANGHFTLN